MVRARRVSVSFRFAIACALFAACAFLPACGGAAAPGGTDVIVLPMASSAPPAPSVIASAPITPATNAKAAPAAPLSVRMRAELAASAASQAIGADDARLYQEGVDAERAGDFTTARKAYFELIEQYPSSPLVAYAYLAFGELFVTDAESDPSKWSIAKQAYEKAMTFPPPNNRAYAYALERHALCMEKTDEHARALGSAKKAIEAARAYPQSPLASDVTESARRTLLDAYAVVGNPAAAFTFFQSIEQPRAAEMCVALGERYLRQQKTKELVNLYRDVLARHELIACDGALRAAEELERTAGIDPRVPAAMRAQVANYCRAP
jgi:TolA-binding protein